MNQPRTRAFAETARALMRRHKQRRPLRGGSLITTVFGDSLAARHCEVSLSGLIGLLAPFGLTERLVRTSIGRLSQDDWVTAQRVGRLSFYRLSAAGEVRFAEATRRIYAAPSEQWRGFWTLLIMPGDADRAGRKRIRDALRWSGFGQLAAGVHIHPEIDVAATQRLLVDAGAGTGAGTGTGPDNSPDVLPLILQSHSDAIEGDRRMVELGWDLDELERRYTRFIASFAPALQSLNREPDPEPQHCFHVRTLLIHEYRKVHLLDPLLPRSLLPRDWAGAAAYELCRRLYLRIAEASDQYVQSMLTTSTGPLPAPAPAVRLRFAPLNDPAARIAAP